MPATMRRLEDAPTWALWSLIVLGLVLWFLGGALFHGPYIVRIVVNGPGLLLAIYSFLILRKRGKPPSGLA